MKRLDGICTVVSLMAGLILAATALIIWPVSYFETWSGDNVITVMLTVALSLLVFGCHRCDLLEKVRSMDRRP